MMSLSRIWARFAVILAILLPAGCSSTVHPTAITQAPLIRVCLISATNQVLVTATEPPTVKASSDSAGHVMPFPSNQPVQIVLGTDGIWRIGNVPSGSGDLILQPASDGSLRVNSLAYRGRYRLTPNGPGKFDVINDLDIDSYLKGVLSSELPRSWQMEAYKAQAITARTYALYHAHMDGLNRQWDVYSDTRSQAYGGMAAETDKARQAVESTAGCVLAYGPPGDEHIFEAFFSSCCGGISVSAADAMGGPSIPPLMEQDVGTLCNASPKFNWGPIVITKAELTRRIKLWGAKRNHPVKDMPGLDRIDIQYVNRFGRPISFLMTDTRGTQYAFNAEHFRTACNTDAGTGPTLPSAFCKPVSQADSIAFVDGHGLGHGIGMCQYCAEARAEQGMSAEQILALAFPKSVIVRGY